MIHHAKFERNPSGQFFKMAADTLITRYSVYSVGLNTWSPVFGTRHASFTIFCAHVYPYKQHTQKTFGGTIYIIIHFADTLFIFGHRHNVTSVVVFFCHLKLHVNFI